MQIGAERKQISGFFPMHSICVKERKMRRERIIVLKKSQKRKPYPLKAENDT